MDKFLDRFSNFFVRSVAPSSIFFVLLFFNDMYFNDGCLFCDFQIFLQNAKSIDDVFLYICLALLVLAYGYINQIFSQILDNFIKENYDFCDKEFSALRKKVQAKLTENEKNIFPTIEFNDYNAYQVLGKDIKVSTSHVDEVKSVHTFCVAISFNFIIYGCFYKFDELHGLGSILMIVIVLFLLHFIAKLRYKARNKRLYINYLLKEDKKDKCEKEIKIKSIKVEVDE